MITPSTQRSLSKLQRLVLGGALAACALVVACLNPRPDDFPSSQNVTREPGESPVTVDRPAPQTCEDNPLLAICQEPDDQAEADPGAGNNGAIGGQPDAIEIEEPDAGSPVVQPAPDAGDAGGGSDSANDAEEDGALEP